MSSAYYIFILSGFLLVISVFDATSDFADCSGTECMRLNASNITGPRWPEDIEQDHDGSRYPNAAHYWPFNGTTTPEKILPDLRGKSIAVTLNGVRTTRAEQLGTVMSLDGSDDNIAIKGITSKCIKDPTYCSKGLTVAFWIKYFKGEAILSSGLFIDDRPGPGFKFICSSCSGLEPTKSTDDPQSKEFTVILSTQTQEWRVILDFLPSAWFHFAFTWHQDHGLKVYRNGKIIAKETRPKNVPLRSAKFKIDTIISIGRPDSLHNIFNHGKFDIGHFVIWPYELSAYEVEVAFLTVLAKTTKSLICCHFKKADPCLANPCFDGASCRSMDEKFECICPDISKGPCVKDSCRDRADECSIYKGRADYCRKNGMASVCPKTCNLCGPRVRTTPRATRTQNHRVQTLSPTPTPYPPVKQQHRCPLGKGSKQECICMNCEGNTSPGLSCCIDHLHPNDMDNGIVLLMSSLSMVELLSKVSSLRYLAGEVIKDSCSKSPCFQDNVARKRRSNNEWEYGTPIKSWDGSPISPTNTLNPDSRRDAQPSSSMAPRVQKPINVNVVMYKIGQHPAQQHQIYTAFYVSVDGTNETQIIQPNVVERIMRSKRDLFKEKLNISFDRIVSWRSFSRTFSIGPRAVSPTTVYPSSSTVLPETGNPNIEGQEGRNSTTNMSKSTFIIVLVTGIGGFVVLAIIIIYMLFKFLRRMKGEFVPDKAYPDEQKTDVGSDQLIPSFIDPSAPRITDVPKKTVRTPAQANGNAGGGGGGGGGGSKKAKKPMGVKVTYKPPKWD